MTSELVRHFLLWSLAVNYTVLLVWLIAFVLGRSWIRKLHGEWFGLSAGAFDAIHYGGMAAYKIGILLFNVAPLIALWVVGDGG